MKKQRTFAGKCLNIGLRALGWLVGVPAILYSAFILTFFTGRGEKLTPGEDKMVTGVFGDEVSTFNIRKHFYSTKSLPFKILKIFPPKDKIGVSLIFTDHVVFFMDRDTAGIDFSRTDSSSYLSSFFHEMTHAAWQLKGHRNLNRLKLGNYSKVSLTDSTDFDSLGVEQQANLMGNYAVAFLVSARAASEEHDKKRALVFKEDDRLLKKVIEQKFPSAQKFREDFEKTFKWNKPAVKIKNKKSRGHVKKAR